MPPAAPALRPWRAADAEWYAAASQDEEILRWTTERRGLGADEVRAAISALAPDALAWAVVDPAGGGPIGNAAVAVRAGHVEPSYWLVPAARGRGLATALLVELVRRCRAAGHGRVELVIMAGNAPSRRVAVRAGFVEVGTEDHRTLGRCVRYRHETPSAGSGVDELGE